MASTKAVASLLPSTKTAKPAADPKLCYCRCGTQIARTSTFAQGHDARFVSQLVESTVGGSDANVGLAVVSGQGDIQERINQTTKLIASSVSDALATKYHVAAMNAWDRSVGKNIAASVKASKPKAAKAAKSTVKARVGRWVYEGQVKDGVFHYSTKSGAPARALTFELVK